MKRTNRLCAMLLLPLALCSCSKDELTDELQILQPDTPQDVVEEEYSGFRSTIGEPLEVLAAEDLGGGDKQATRAAIGTDGVLETWATTDNISVSDGTLSITYQPSNISGASTSFVAKAGSTPFTMSGSDTERTFYAFYPADAVSGWNATTVTTMVYTEQKYNENIENSGVMGPYMAAVATTTGGGARASFTFGHICSVVDVDLSTFDGGEVEAVSIYSNSQISLAGKLQYNFSNQAVTVLGNDGQGYSYSTQSEMVKVSEVNATQPTVRFYLLPTKQEKGFTITVRTTDGNYYTKSSATAVGTSAINTDYLKSQSGITGGTLCKPYYKKYNFGTKAGARTQNWMSMIPGNIKFNFLSIPGTHDAATSSCSSSAAKCQAYTIAEQLAKGCRALDLRPGFDKEDLTIYHGIASTGVKLSDALDAVKTFLSNNPTETVFILIHEEDTRLISWGAGPHQTSWATRVWNCINGYTDYIASYGWSGNLNPCRGKMVVIFRDNYTDGDSNADLGCGKVGWGSSFSDKSILTGNGSTTARGTLRYQDEYDTSSESTKLTNLTTMLTSHIAANETNASYTFVNNTNISSGTSNVSGLASKVNNAVLSSSTFTSHTGRFGIMMTDFLFSSDYKGDKMFNLIHEQNYKYAYKGRTRCSH